MNLPLVSCLHYIRQSKNANKWEAIYKIIRSNKILWQTYIWKWKWSGETLGFISNYILTAITFTSEVFPAFCSPIKESSISCLKKRLKQQLKLVSTCNSRKHQTVMETAVYYSIWTRRRIEDALIKFSMSYNTSFETLMLEPVPCSITKELTFAQDHMSS